MAQCLMFLRNGMLWKSQTTDNLHPLKLNVCCLFFFSGDVFGDSLFFGQFFFLHHQNQTTQPNRGKDNGPLIGSMNYEELLAEGDPMARWDPPIDEWDSLSLCYTSGTTADPKGAQNGGNHQRECKG